MAAITNVWSREKGERTIAYGHAARGIRTPNGQPWGHDLDDFYRIERVPGIPVETLWSISMIQEFYSQDKDDKGNSSLRATRVDGPHMPRVRQPWPLLKLPDGVPCKQSLGVQDRWSAACCPTRGERPPVPLEDAQEQPSYGVLDQQAGVVTDDEQSDPRASNSVSPEGITQGRTLVFEKGALC